MSRDFTTAGRPVRRFEQRFRSRSERKRRVDTGKPLPDENCLALV